MAPEADTLDWSLASADSSMRLVWRKLGPVVWSGSAAGFPAAPERSGIYLIKVALDHRYRIYIGEAANLNKRLRSYGGRTDEKPNERGKTTSNMKGRVRRTCRAGGSVTVYLLELPIEHIPGRGALDPDCKDCRITLERISLSAAYLRGEPLINEHGFPKYPSEDPLV